MVDAPETPAPPPYRSPDTAPFIYFDLAPTYGVLAGAIQIELAARILIPTQSRGAAPEIVTTAHLRCSPGAARNLVDALRKALEMLEQPQATSGAGSATLN